MNNKLFDTLVVVKRSGQRVNFNGLKIALAVKSAFDSVCNSKYNENDINKVYDDILNYIISTYKDRKTVTVEDIQDIIETILQNDKYIDVYKSFSTYRLRRSESRKAFSVKRQHKFVKVIEKISSDDSIFNNSPQGSLLKFGEIISNEYNKTYILDNKYLRAFEEGKIFIHDFNYFNLGFIYNVHLKLDDVIDSEEECFELLNLLTNAKKEVSGEISIDNLDLLLSKSIINTYKSVLKDKIKNYLNVYGLLEYVNYKKVIEIVNSFDTLSINENSFKDINLNIQINNIINLAYNDTITYINSHLQKFINKLLSTLNNITVNNKYSISISSTINNETTIVKNIILDELRKSSIFKNITIVFKLNKKSEEQYIKQISLLIESKKNIKLLFDDSSFNKKLSIDYFSNGYRIYDSEDEFVTTGRMMVCNTSINMVRLALEHKSLSKNFYLDLDETLELVKNELLFTFETIGDKSKDNYHVLFKNNILDDEKLESGQKIRKVIKNGTLNINLIGLKECAQIINNTNVVNELLKYINNKVGCYIKDTKLNFTLSSVNELDASSTFIKLDKIFFGSNDLTKKSKYDDLCKININELTKIKELVKYQSYLTGGVEVIISDLSHSSCKKIMEIIELLIDSDVGFVKIGSEMIC